MSHFYGTMADLEDSPITRYSLCSESGVQANLGSSEGSVSIRVYEGEAADGGLEDRVRIVFKGEQEFELYDGSLAECDFNAIRTNTHEAEEVGP